MKDTIIYIRKSREDLENKDDTLKNHTDILTRLCKKNNWDFDLYAEVGTSDSIESRTEIKKVIAAIKKGNVQRLVVMALDRLSRNNYDGAYIQKLLEEHNVIVVTPQKTYDYSNDSDLMLSDFERVIAAQEYRVIKKRLAIGKQIGAENGRMVTGEPPLGYYFDRNTKTVKIDSERAKVYRWIVEEYLTGNWTTHTLAIEFNKKGYRGDRGALANNNRIWKILCNRFYLGEVKYKEVWYPGNHEPLISEDEFNQIQKQLKGNNKIPQRQGYRKIKRLSQICTCGCCGHTLTIVADQKAGNYARCWYADPATGDRCKQVRVFEEDILEQLDIAIKAHINDMQESISKGNTNYQDKLKKALEKDMKAYEDEIEKITTREKNTVELAKDGIISVAECKSEINKLKERKSDVQTSLSVLLYKYENMSKDVKQELKHFKDIYKQLNRTATEEEYNSLVREIINKIVVTRSSENRDEIMVDISFL